MFTGYCVSLVCDWSASYAQDSVHHETHDAGPQCDFTARCFGSMFLIHRGWGWWCWSYQLQDESLFYCVSIFTVVGASSNEMHIWLVRFLTVSSLHLCASTFVILCDCNNLIVWQVSFEPVYRVRILWHKSQYYSEALQGRQRLTLFVPVAGQDKKKKKKRNMRDWNIKIQVNEHFMD